HRAVGIPRTFFCSPFRRPSQSPSSDLSSPSESLRVVLLGHFSARRIEARGVNHADFVCNKAHCRRQHAQPILHAAPEVDRGGFGKALRWAGDLSNTESEFHCL